jgi:hypothetical protein
MDEHALWADLDEVDPRQIDDYPPTIAWETSPKRYQALWLVVGGDMQGASWAGRENQRMTYHLGADLAGWDTTQLLRLPGWNNHKPEYRSSDGKPAPGKLLWKDGRQYLPDEFGDLPEVSNGMGAVSDVLEDEIAHVDRHEVWGRVRLRVSSRVREFVAARQVAGDRSEVLWEIERELADAGCSVTEIVAIVRHTVWNKFAGRSDELRRLTTEASKAIAQRSDEANEKVLEETQERPKPTNLFALVMGLRPPKWLIRDILTEGAVGFIAGQPKSFKSWAGLDMVLSVASGQPFLGHFQVEQPGSTLYIQEEDSAPLIGSRLNKVWPGKLMDKIIGDGNGGLLWVPGQEVDDYPDVDAYIGNGFVISDPAWQAWLDEILATKANGEGVGYKLLVIDTLMMVAGDVEENRAQEMTTKVFRPLKELSRKHNIAIQLIHHMRKGDPRAGPQRGGQMMLGSVANHAWAEDSMYFKLGKGGNIVCEQESKNAPVPGFTISGIRNRRWTPVITISRDAEGAQPDGAEGAIREAPKSKGTRSSGRPKSENNTILTAFQSLGPGSHTVATLSATAGISRQAVYSAIKRYPEISKNGHGYTLERQPNGS